MLYGMCINGLEAWKFQNACLAMETAKIFNLSQRWIRDRPCNLKGWGYGFLFRTEFCFRTKQELEYLFILSRKSRIFFPEFNIRLYDKNSESDYFFPPPQSDFFSATLGIRIFKKIKKKHNPRLQVKLSFPNNHIFSDLVYK